MRTLSLIFRIILMTSIVAPTSCAQMPSIGGKKNPSKSSKKKSSKSRNGETDSTNGSLTELNLTCGKGETQSYRGLGNKDLTIGRIEEIPTLGDRSRIKPFSALSGEFTRVMNVVPSSLSTNGATFSVPAERWSVEPSLNGVNVFTFYRAAYEAALNYTSKDASLSEAPTEESATKICTDIAEKAWNRSPTDHELEACVKVAIADTAKVGDGKKRWAYTIASILTSSGFLSY